MAVFTIFGHRLFRRAHGPSGSSPLACLLPRVRGMRDAGVWPPLTPGYTGIARCSRVAEARAGICQLPPPYTPAEHTDQAGPKLRRWSIFVIVLLLALAAVVFLVMAETKASRAVYGLRYPLTAAPPFLAENVAMTHALRALADSGVDASLWVPVKVEDANRTLAPDNRRDVFLIRPIGHPNFGTIEFRHVDSTNSCRTVQVGLGGNEIQCSVH